MPEKWFNYRSCTYFLQEEKRIIFSALCVGHDFVNFIPVRPKMVFMAFWNCAQVENNIILKTCYGHMLLRLNVINLKFLLQSHQKKIHHTVWRTQLPITYSVERWSAYYQFSLPYVYVSLKKVGRMYFLNLGVKGLNTRAWRAVQDSFQPGAIVLDGLGAFALAGLGVPLFLAVSAQTREWRVFAFALAVGSIPYLDLRVTAAAVLFALTRAGRLIIIFLGAVAVARLHDAVFVTLGVVQ